MRYVERDASGAVCSVHATPRPGAQEALPDGHPDLAAFLAGGPAREVLHASDLALVRVIEDLVDLLVQKGVILFTDLPAPAREKLLARGRLRQQLGGDTPVLSDDAIL